MGAKVKSKDCGRSGGNRVKSPHAHSCHKKHLPRLWRPVFTIPKAVFSELGAVFRKLKTGLFISRDGHFTVSFTTFAPQTYHYGYYSKG